MWDYFRGRCYGCNYVARWGAFPLLPARRSPIDIRNPSTGNPPSRSTTRAIALPPANIRSWDHPGTSLNHPRPLFALLAPPRARGHLLIGERSAGHLPIFRLFPWRRRRFRDLPAVMPHACRDSRIPVPRFRGFRLTRGSFHRLRNPTSCEAMPDQCRERSFRRQRALIPILVYPDFSFEGKANRR